MTRFVLVIRPDNQAIREKKKEGSVTHLSRVQYAKSYLITYLYILLCLQSRDNCVSRMAVDGNFVVNFITLPQVMHGGRERPQMLSPAMLVDLEWHLV
jgi:hypothetical protein